MKCSILGLVLIELVFVVFSYGDSSCVAIELVDDNFEEIYNFSSKDWNSASVSLTSSDYNIPPMTGEYIYELSFCNNVQLFMGADRKTGWSFGQLESFFWVNINSSNAPHDQYSAYKEFIQGYSAGDNGPPCNTRSRSSTVNIYCGSGKANCTQVPGNKGVDCLAQSNALCLCSVEYKEICSGLTLNLLSNSCPKGIAVVIPVPPSPTPTPENNGPGRTAGITFGVLLLFLFGIFLCGMVVNFINGKTGCAIFPFYENCNSSRDEIRYNDPHVQIDARGTYGSTD